MMYPTNEAKSENQMNMIRKFETTIFSTALSSGLKFNTDFIRQMKTSY